MGDFGYVSYFADTDNVRLDKDISDIRKSKGNIAKKVYLAYIREQKKSYALAYDDLLAVTLRILSEREDIRDKWQQRIQYVMVDEFQDVSRLNYELAEVLSGYHKNLFVVGDPDQTIYSWRGAKVDFILDFDKVHKDTKTIVLDTNYRSKECILKAANSLIAANTKRIKKNLIAAKDGGNKPVYFHAKDTQAEAQWITSQIKMLVASGYKFSDIAVLYRSHYVSRSVEEAFLKESIPYVVYSGVRFYERKEVKDTLAYLRMTVDADDISFMRIINEPKRGIGNKRIAYLREYANKHQCSLFTALKDNIDNTLFEGAIGLVNLIEKYSNLRKDMRLSDMVDGILNDSGYEVLLRDDDQDRLNNIAELKQSMAEAETRAGEEYSLEEYLQDVALFTNIDKDNTSDAVRLMTIHTAKGLEFPAVFVCGMNEGIFPSSRTDNLEKMEEERRLAYVAYTRAEDALFISDAEGYDYNSGLARSPSRFIFDTGEANLDYVIELDNELVQKTKTRVEDFEQMASPKTDLKVGDRVQHKVLGLGNVVNIIDDSTLVVKFDNAQTERNMSIYSPMKKLDK